MNRMLINKGVPLFSRIYTSAGYIPWQPSGLLRSQIRGIIVPSKVNQYSNPIRGATDFPSKPLEKLRDENYNPPLEAANYENPNFATHREITPPPGNRRKFIAFLIASVITWGLGLKFAFNYSKLSSSSVTAATFIARNDDEVIEKLGTNVDTPSMFTEIKGKVNNVRGDIDIEYDISGSKKIVAKIILKSHRDQNNKNTWTTDEFYVQYPDGSRTILEL
ncbi:Cytochrome c oxidase assembly factor 1 [Smittium mucronatum]|uniref:Cytochrome c oxidase assembly factor 1 n=1 Tax=Smittium mucronatum TaxID=133383 RepID=A0A1R0GPX7_9FUNG|nr:Cytochrome c oxidase assembly factor 1 [Smittium mucronatum]